MDWDKLRIFHAVASAGSFTHAGQMLMLSQSAVSRQISALEEEITTPLFQRHARGLTLTDEGELLYGAVADVLARLGQAEEALKERAVRAPRFAQVTTSHGLGAYWVLPRMREFMQEFPELQVHMVFEDRELDLTQREADLAIRMRAPVQADLIQRKLFTVHYHLYATAEYLARAGTPVTFEDLAKHPAHRLWRDGGAGNPRRELAGRQCAPRGAGRHRQRAAHQHITGILMATEAGMGIAALPDYLTAERRGLVRVMPDIEGPTFDVHLVYCDALRQSKRVAAFRDFVVKAAKDWSF